MGERTDFKLLFIFVVCTLLLATVVDSVDKRGKLERYIEEYKAYTASVEKTEKVIQHLQDSVDAQNIFLAAQDGVVVRLTADLERLKRGTPPPGVLSALRDSAKALRLTQDSVEMARTVIPILDGVIAHQDTLLIQKDSVISTQDTLVSVWRGIAQTREQQGVWLQFALDTCRETLNNLPGVPPNPNKTFLGLELPSRKVVFVGGVAVGSALTAWMYSLISAR
jgi:hypothetical protein